MVLSTARVMLFSTTLPFMSRGGGIVTCTIFEYPKGLPSFVNASCVGRTNPPFGFFHESARTACGFGMGLADVDWFLVCAN